MPLSIYLNADLIGTGNGWSYNYGSLEQIIAPASPITLTKAQSVNLDVHANLTKLRDYTFGIELARVDSAVGREELAVLGRIYKIKAFL